MVTTADVGARMGKMKKPTSYVTIDVPGQIVNRMTNEWALPMARIINAVRRGEGWPSIWKREEVATLPKNGHPTDMDDCRGVSCTSVFSKLTETFMLEMLRDEIDLEGNQFGGIPGSSTNHILGELITGVMEELEEPGAVATIMTIDYQKAFNRMPHHECVGALVEKGASN